jgi:hypothetical protein
MNELIDESVERIFLCSTPIKWDTLLRQVVERCSNGAEISHETLIKSRKAKETSKLCESCRNQSAFMPSIFASSTSMPCGVTT